MAWGDLAANQLVSFLDMSGSGIALNSGQSHGSTNQIMTKTDIITKYNVNTGAISSYASNQCVVKGDIESGGTTGTITWTLDYGYDNTHGVSFELYEFLDFNTGSGWFSVVDYYTYVDYTDVDFYDIVGGTIDAGTLFQQAIVVVFPSGDPGTIDIIDDMYFAQWGEDPEYYEILNADQYGIDNSLGYASSSPGFKLADYGTRNWEVSDQLGLYMFVTTQP